jgi:DUF4097 and DUF4098 domain-containing protein YvlB
MRLISVGVGVVLCALLVPPAAQAQSDQNETETIDRTVSFPPNGVLKLHTFSGDVEITGTDGHDLVIHAVRTAPRERLDRITLDITTSGSTVSVDANHRVSGSSDDRDNVVKTAFEIQVPSSAELDIEGFSSDLTIRGVAGEQRLKTFSGRIDAADVRAPVDAHTFSGDVELDASEAGAAPKITAETFSGSIRTRLDSSASGSVEFNSFSGRIESDLPVTFRSMSRQHMTGALPGGASGGTLALKTFSGNVRLMR